VLRSCRYVDRVVPNPQREAGDSILGLLEELGAGIIVVGSDWRDRDYLAQIGVTQAELDNLGWYVVFVPYTEGISTSEIVRRLACA
jgi:glycerol-3-phosphate cytidylyltransferase